MDLSLTTAPDSTQINAEDFVAGARTVTITGVRQGTAEQPVNIDLAEFPGRAYRPGKSMRRVLVAAWGADSTAYIGRRLTLFCDPEISFGRDKVGGIRVSHMSDLAKPLTIALTVTRGKRAPYVVKPLAAEPVATILPVNPPKQPMPPVLLNDINTGLTRLGITDPDAKLAAVSQVIGRDVANPRDLSRDEAAAVLTWISEQPEAKQ